MHASALELALPEALHASQSCIEIERTLFLLLVGRPTRTTTEPGSNRWHLVNGGKMVGESHRHAVGSRTESESKLILNSN
jgi:hypothetical protein